jgi:hypothetical protein
MFRVLALALYLICTAVCGAEVGINDSGTWRSISKIGVNDSGTWRTIQRIGVNDGGTWRVVFQYLAVTMPDVNVTAQGNNPNTVSLTIASNGTFSVTASGDSTSGTDSGTWLTVGANTDFEVRLTGAGDTPSGSALNTWLATTSGRSWTLQTSSSPESKAFSGTLEFRLASDSTVVDTSTVSMTADQL